MTKVLDPWHFQSFSEIFAKSGEELLGDHKSLISRKVERNSCGWTVHAAVRPERVNCPECGEPSSSRHSNYVRQLWDLPVQGPILRLRIQLSRWRCRNAGCKRKIFLPALEPSRSSRRARNRAIRANAGTDCLLFGWLAVPTAQSTSGTSDQWRYTSAPDQAAKQIEPNHKINDSCRRR